MRVDEIRQNNSVSFRGIRYDKYSDKLLNPIKDELTELSKGYDVLITQLTKSERVKDGYVTDNSLYVSVGPKPAEAKNLILKFIYKKLGFEYPERGSCVVLKRTLHNNNGEEDVLLEFTTEDGIFKEIKQVLQLHLENFKNTVSRKNIHRLY